MEPTHVRNTAQYITAAAPAVRAVYQVTAIGMVIHHGHRLATRDTKHTAKIAETVMITKVGKTTPHIRP